MSDHRIPYKNLNTIFLDAGNTLVSMDLSWVRKKLKGLGVTCEINDLVRAEAAARPALSAEMENLKSTEDRKTSIFYMRRILERLPAVSLMTDEECDEIIEALINGIKAPDRTRQFWSNLLPGVRDALDILKNKGIQLLVVSNSNGTIEDITRDLEIRQYFHKVVDSHIVGFEKPDQRLFRHALKISEAEPERTLHIGDLYHVDVLGAWSAGIHALLLDPFDDWQDVDCVKMPDLLTFARIMADL
jgi:HAD superfamily hydrolase (TIGR01509 family)